MQRVVPGACRKSQMHDQDVRALCEIDEFGVRSHLIRAEDDRHIRNFHAIRKRRHVAMRDSLRRHGKSITVEDGRWFSFRYVDDPDIQANTAPRREPPVWYVAPLSSECGSKHRERAIFLVKKACEKCREIGRGV